MPNLRCWSCGTIYSPSSVYCPACAAPIMLRGRYLIKSEIGRGGFSKIYRVIDTLETGTNNIHALKIVNEDALDVAAVESDVVRLLREHGPRLPFVPAVYEEWREQSKFHLVMQYIEGRTLKGLQWPSHQVESFLRTLLGYLIELHRIGIIHRDIKPENIMQTPVGNFVLIDFGIAKHDTVHSVPGHTPDYAPIEQINRSGTDARSDLFSLGATTYQLLTGNLPVHCTKRLSSEPLLPTLRNVADVPAHLQHVLLRMLEVKPEKRPGSAREALTLLDAKDTPTVRPDAGVMQTPVLPLIAEPALPGLSESIGVVDSVQATALPEIPFQRCIVGKGRVLGASWSADGRELYVGTTLGVYRYVPQALEQGQLFFAAPGTQQVVFAANNALLALVTSTEAQLRQLHTGTLVKTVPGAVPDGLALAPDGRSFALISGDRLALHRIDSDEVVPFDVAVADSIEQLVFAPDGRSVMVLVGRVVLVWDTSSGKLINRLDSAERVRHILFSPDGQMVAIATRQSVRLWRPADGRVLRTIGDEAEVVSALVFAPDGATLAVGCGRSLRLWHIADGHQIWAHALEAGDLVRVNFDPGGQRLAVAAGTLVQILHTSDGSRLAELPVFTASVSNLVYASDGSLLAIVAEDGAHLWSGDGSPRGTTPGHLGAQQSIAVTSEGSFVASMGGTITLWHSDGEALTFSQSFNGPTSSPNGLAFSSDGYTLVAASQEATNVYDLQSGTLLLQLAERVSQFRSVAFAAKHRIVVITDTVVVIQLDDGSTVSKLEPTDEIYDVALSADGQIVAVLSDQGVEVRRVEDGGRITQLSATLLSATKEDNAINSVALAADGALLAVVGNEAITIWSCADQCLKQTIMQGASYAVFARTSDQLALIREAVIELWPLQTNTPVRPQQLVGHADLVNDVAFSPDSRVLFSASSDGTIRAWQCQ